MNFYKVCKILKFTSWKKGVVEGKFNGMKVDLSDWRGMTKPRFVAGLEHQVSICEQDPGIPKPL